MKTNNANKRWTSYENKILIEMMASGFTFAEAGARLGRSPGAVEFQWRQIDPSKKPASPASKTNNPRNHRHTWSVRDVRTLIDMYDSGESYEDIAAALGRKVSSVKKYHSRIGLGGVKELPVYSVKRPAKLSKDISYAVAFALIVSAFIFSLAALSL